MYTLTLTENQLYELNDAASEVIARMLRDGQNDIEIKLHALTELWGAYKALHLAMVGTTDTPAIQDLEPKVMAAISKPKKKKA